MSTKLTTAQMQELHDTISTFRRGGHDKQAFQPMPPGPNAAPPPEAQGMPPPPGGMPPGPPPGMPPEAMPPPPGGMPPGAPPPESGGQPLPSPEEVVQIITELVQAMQRIAQEIESIKAAVMQPQGMPEGMAPPPPGMPPLAGM